MSRLPNFKIDNDVFGKKGESLFESYAKRKKYMILDVTEDKNFQDKDIDFIIILNPEYNAERILAENLFTKYSSHKDNWVTVEVKTDTRTFGTRNLVYEVLSHDNPGCLARSVADFIFYVAVNDDATQIYEAWMVNLKKWRTWIRETSPRLNSEDAKTLPIRIHNFNTYGDACLNFLCNVEELVKQKIAVKINLEDESRT